MDKTLRGPTLANTLIIPTCGLGSRLGLDVPKVLAPLHGKPALDYVLAQADGIFDEIIIVCREEQAEYFAGYNNIKLAIHNETNGSREACLTGLASAEQSDKVLFQWADLIVPAYSYKAMLEAELDYFAGFSHCKARYSLNNGLLTEHARKYCYGLCGLYGIKTKAKHVLENCMGEDIADVFVALQNFEAIDVNVTDFGDRELWLSINNLEAR